MTGGGYFVKSRRWWTERGVWIGVVSRVHEHGIAWMPTLTWECQVNRRARLAVGLVGSSPTVALTWRF